MKMVKEVVTTSKLWKNQNVQVLFLKLKRTFLKMTSKLKDSNTAPKTYYSILNHFLYNKNIPSIRSLLVDGNFISDFCEKANLFNNFFTFILTPIKNNSRLPPFIYKANTRIHCFCVTNKDILSMINSLNFSKAHGYDKISIKMINICNRVSYYTPNNHF